MKKAVLAFSGGLDTSYCLVYLTKIRNLEVHTITVDTGGFTEDELKDIERRAYELGATSHHCVNATPEFYNDCIRYLVFGNILKNHTYPLSVSAERMFQAMVVARHVKETGSDYVVHGSTGAGNDQVRFDMAFHVLIPDVEIITPIREQRLSRQAEIDFLRSHSVEMDFERAKYSINKGIWGTSVGGQETLTSHTYLPEDAFPTGLSKTEPSDIVLVFEKGELAGINEQLFTDRVHAIRELREIAAPYAIGRDIHVGDTIIGIKGRVGFEAPAPLIIIKAHQLLEKHVLTKWQIYWKDLLASWYGNWLHEGQFLDPVMRNIETFMEEIQEHVSGKVFVRLQPYRFTILGIESPHDLMHPDFGNYGEMNNTWTGEDVRGFSKIFGNQTRIYHSVNSNDYGNKN